MARYTGPVCKICRNEGAKLFLKGERCFSPKCSIAKRPYPSGQHGQARKKMSEYAIHLREKQKLRRSYFVLEKQFARYFNEAERKKGVTGTILLQFLETRFDNIIYKAGFAPSKKTARQLVRHRHFLVNGTITDIPSFRVKPGDEITVRVKSQNLVKEYIDAGSTSVVPHWLTVDTTASKIKMESLPERSDVDPTIREQLIIEYYSK